MAQDVVSIISRSAVLPKLFARDADAERGFIEFCIANIGNPKTRRAYVRAALEFSVWCEENGVRELADIEPIHIAADIELVQTRVAAPSAKSIWQRSACCSIGLISARSLQSIRGARFAVLNTRSRKAKPPSCRSRKPASC